MQFHTEIETKFTKDEIMLETYTVFDNVRQKIWTETMNLKDEQTRKALIALGWTPPLDDK